MGNILITFGVLVIVTGIFLNIFTKGLGPILPGDIFIRRGNFTIYFPLTTVVIVRLILTVILYFF